MDIKIFLSGIKSLTDFQRISQLPCFSSNVNFKGIIPILMQNFLCFDFKDNLLSKKIPQTSIKLFKIILTNLDDLEIEQNNVDILQLFKYILEQADKFITLPYPNVGRILFWGVMEEIIPIISKTVSRSPSLRQAVVLHLQDRFLSMILSSPPFSVAQISFLVSHLNACLQSLPSPPKIKPYQSSKLGALMCSCGDYPLQVMLLELYNFLGMRPVLPPGRAYSHLHANITKDNFHEDCRSFLNKINSLELQVVSFQCSDLAIGSIVIRGPLWVDWNHGSFRVSWACDGAALGLSPNNLEHFSLRLEEVRHINYRRQKLTLDGARVSAGSPEACALFENMPPCLVLTFLEKQDHRLEKILKLLNDRMPPQIKLDQDNQSQYIFQFPAASEVSDIPFPTNRPSSSQDPHSPPSILSKLMKDLHIPKSDIKNHPEVSAIQETSITETDLSVENLLRDLDMILATPPAPPAPPAPGFQRRKVSKTGRLEIPMAQRKVSFVDMKIHAAPRFPPEAHAMDSDENNAVTSPIPVLKQREIPMAQRKVSFVDMKIHAAPRFPPEAHAVDSDENNAVTSPIPVLKQREIPMAQRKVSFVDMKIHAAPRFPPEAHAVDSDENNAVTSPIPVLKQREIPMAQRKVSFVDMKIHAAPRFPPEAHAVDSDENNAVTSPIPVLKQREIPMAQRKVSFVDMKIHAAPRFPPEAHAVDSDENNVVTSPIPVLKQREIPMAEHKVSFVDMKIHAAPRFPPEAHAVDSDENNAVTSPIPVLKQREIPMAQCKVSFVGMKIHASPRFPPKAHEVDSDENNAVTSPIPVLKKRRDRPTNTKLVDSTLSMIGKKDLHKADKILNVQFQDVSGELKKIDIKVNEEYSIRNKLSLINKIPDLPTTMKFSRTTKRLFNANVSESTSLVKQTPLEMGKPLDDLPQENEVQSISIPLINLEKENVQSTSKKPINLIKVRSIKSSGDMKQILYSGLSQDSSTMNNLESHPVDIEKKVLTAESSSRESSKRKKLDIQSSSSHCATRSTKNKKNLNLKAKLKSKVEVEPKLLKMNPVIGNDEVVIEIDLTDRDISPLDKDRAAQELCKMYGPKPRWSEHDKSFPQEILMEDDLKNVKEVEFEVSPSQPKTDVSNLLSLSRGVLDAEIIRRINSSGSESDIYIPASPRKAPPPANMATTPAVSGNKIDGLIVEKVPVSNEGVTNSRKRNIKQVKTSKQNQNYAAKKASKRFKDSSPNQKQDYSMRDNLIKDSHFQSPEIVLLPNEANVTKRRKLYSAKYDDPDLLMYQCPSEEEIPSPLMQEDKTKGAAVSGTSRGSQTHSTASFSYRHNKDQPTPRDIRISETFDSLKAMAPTYPHEAESLHFQYTFADYDESVHKSTTASKKQKKGIAEAKKDSKKYMKLPITRKPNKELTNVITGEISGKTLNMVRNHITLVDKVVRCNPCDNAHLEKDDVPYKDIVCIDLSEDDVPLAKLSQFEMVHPDRPTDIPKITKQTCSGLKNLAIQKNKKIAKSNKKITDSKSSVHLVPPALDTSLPSLTVENLPILKYNNSFDGDNIMEWIVNKCPLLDITGSSPPLEFDKEETEMRHLSQSSALIDDCIDLTLEDEPEMSGQHHISDGPADNLVLHSSQSTNSCQTDSTLHSEDTVIGEEPILHQTEKEPKNFSQKLPIFDFDHTKYVNEVSPASSPDLIYCGSEPDSLHHEGVQGVSKGINIEALKQCQMSSTESTGTSSKSSLNLLSTKKYGTAVAKTLPCPSNRDDLQPSENENSVNNVSQKQMPQCTVNMMKNNLCVIREPLMPSLESTGTSSKSPLNPMSTKRMEDRIEEVTMAQLKTSFKMGWDIFKKVIDELLNDQ